MIRKIKNRLLNIQRCIREFGFFNGLKVALQLAGSKGKIEANKIPHPLYLRPKNHEDRYSFYELFLQKQYNFNFDFDPKVIIDAGANIGYASVYFANKYPNAMIIAIEPSDENFQLLKKNVESYPNVTPIHCALWKDKNGVNIHNPDAGNRGFMVESGSSDIPSETVQSLLTKFNIDTIDIFKIDIEGAEKEVFEADCSWMSNTKAIFIELHDRMRPYSSVPFFKEIAKHEFMHAICGENLLFYYPKEN